MEFITRERFDRNLKNKHYIDLAELVNVIETEFGYFVKLEEKNKDDFSTKQRETMTKSIFNNPIVLKQLQESSEEDENEYIENEEDFVQIIREHKDNE
ncbi:MAG TPA: hypothetical protein VK190_03785 [Pseudoneobacillus sp.]|nr:hypothetical protein [Pseudoneobacillus sp.]